MGAFHQNNQLLIGNQVVVFVVSGASVWLDITFRGRKAPSTADGAVAPKGAGERRPRPKKEGEEIRTISGD
jgi:hypothetical protein